MSEFVKSLKEENGVIYFTLVSNGMTGAQWKTHFNAKGITVDDDVEYLLRSPEFKPTNGVIYKIAILKGENFYDTERHLHNMQKQGKKRGFVASHPEVACLIRDSFTDQEIIEMGVFWIKVMHDPIKLANGASRIFCIRNCNGNDLGTYDSCPGHGENPGNGFAFVIPQIDTQN